MLAAALQEQEEAREAVRRHRKQQRVEAQAVGRIRRYPQTRTVRVYRVFAQGTIEESLYAARGAPVRGV